MTGALLLLGAALAGGGLGPPLRRRARRLAAGRCWPAERALLLCLGIPFCLVGLFNLLAVMNPRWVLLGVFLFHGTRAGTGWLRARRGMEPRQAGALRVHVLGFFLVLLLGVQVLALEAHRRGRFPAGQPRLTYALLGEAARPLVLREAGSPNGRVRAEALRAMREMDREAAAPLLAHSLEDPDPRVRAAGAAELGKLRTAAGMAELVGLLTDPQVRLEAWQTLRRQGPAAGPYLRWAARDGRPSAPGADASAAQGEAGRVGKQMEGVRRRLRARWGDARAGALRLAVENGQSPATLTLLALCRDPDAKVRAAAEAALRRPGAVQELSLLAAGPDPVTAAAARRVLLLADPESAHASRGEGHPESALADCPMCRAAARLDEEAPGP